MNEQLQIWRRELHQIPELGLKEYQTTKYLTQELKKMNYQVYPLLETGVYVYIDNGSSYTIAFRSDIDGLPIEEMNDIDYCAKENMHACGHDGHMAMLLGLAKYLSNTPSHVNILLLFQPAEESPGGAKFIIEKGILDQYHVEAIFGIHLMPMLESGKLYTRPGSLMAKCGELDITIEGKDGHAGLPHEGIDTIMISSILIQQYQTIVSRLMSPFEPIVLHIGKINAGEARNSIASKCQLEGTVRCYNDEVYDSINKHIEDINRSLEKAYHCKITYSCPPFYPALINDETLYKIVEDDVHYLKEPLMLAEDFAYYTKYTKGLFTFLGTRDDIYQSGLHTNTFNFNEDVLIYGVNYYIDIIRKMESYYGL